MIEYLSGNEKISDLIVYHVWGNWNCIFHFSDFSNEKLQKDIVLPIPPSQRNNLKLAKPKRRHDSVALWLDLNASVTPYSSPADT